jgi:predicted ATPase
LADYRNFAHGRQYWLVKRGDSSAVVALVSAADRALAECTLNLIPADIPRAQIDFIGGDAATALAALIAALWMTDWAGHEGHIDPGRAEIPEFGRRLYNLSLPPPGP